MLLTIIIRPSQYIDRVDMGIQYIEHNNIIILNVYSGLKENPLEFHRESNKDIGVQIKGSLRAVSHNDTRMIAAIISVSAAGIEQCEGKQCSVILYHME